MGAGGVVRPVDGAQVVAFDHRAATQAAAELSAMADVLAGQVAMRRGPRDHVVTDWQGRLRDEFDRAWETLQARLAARAEALRVRIGLVHSAIDEANARQLRLNRAAEREAADGASAGPV